MTTAIINVRVDDEDQEVIDIPHCTIYPNMKTNHHFKVDVFRNALERDWIVQASYWVQDCRLSGKGYWEWIEEEDVVLYASTAEVAERVAEFMSVHGHAPEGSEHPFNLPERPF